jgi:gliding motility-associated lipoprotein GldH
MRKINRYFLPVILFVAVQFVACDNYSVYNTYIAIPDMKWEAKKPVVFNVEITDTINAHNVYVNIRNSSKYENMNLFLFIHTTSPSGAELIDTMECTLADDRGKWLGSGWGDIYDNQFLYKKQVRFPVQGEYTFKITQAMRTEELKNISDVGLRIDKLVFK